MKTLSLLLSCGLLCSVAMGSVKESIQKAFPLSADGSVELSNVNGSIEIEAWDKNELSMEACKEAKNEDNLKRMEVVIDAAPDRISIETRYEKKLFNSSNGSVHYKLKVPANCKLSKVHTVNSAVSVEGVRNDAKISTVNGSIKISGGSKTLVLHTVNGSIHAKQPGLSSDSMIEIETVNGACTLALPSDTKAATIDASTINGGVNCAFPVTIEHSGKHSLKGQIGEGGPRLKLRTVNGEIRIEKI